MTAAPHFRRHRCCSGPPAGERRAHRLRVGDAQRSSPAHRSRALLAARDHGQNRAVAASTMRQAHHESAPLLSRCRRCARRRHRPSDHSSIVARPWHKDLSGPPNRPSSRRDMAAACAMSLFLGGLPTGPCTSAKIFPGAVCSTLVTIMNSVCLIRWLLRSPPWCHHRGSRRPGRLAPLMTVT